MWSGDRRMTCSYYISRLSRDYSGIENCLWCGFFWWSRIVTPPTLEFSFPRCVFCCLAGFSEASIQRRTLCGGTAALYTLPLVRTGIRLSLSAPERSLHFIHPVFLRWVTSVSIVLSFQMIDPMYLKWSTCLSVVFWRLRVLLLLVPLKLQCICTVFSLLTRSPVLFSAPLANHWSSL